MDVLPSTIVLDIFSRLPARSRCVSKVWCSYIDDRYLTIIHDKRLVEEPTPMLYHQHQHQHLSRDRMNHSLCFHVIESKQSGTINYVLEPKEGPFFEYFHKKPLSKYSRVSLAVRGSCNGLICLSQDDECFIISLVVVHPRRKECYELPPLPVCLFHSMGRESCGFGFDASTNTFKIVCVFCKSYQILNNPDVVKKYLRTMVHVFGSNSWREIPQVPSYPIAGKAVFANGCLHWLVSHYDVKTEDGGREVIWFDVNKEEFGLINRPKRMCNLWRNYSCLFDHLVDLNGKVGYVCCRTMEVWVLNKQKEWVPHCRFEKETVPDGYIDVIGCWNKDGDMLIKNRHNGRYAYFVYNLKNGALHKTNVVGPKDSCDPNIIMYPNDLLSIHGINANCCSMKKTDMKESCQQILSLD